MKKIFTLFFLTATLLFAQTLDQRLLQYPQTKEWLKDADTNGESAYNIGLLYQKYINDNAKAIEWYTKAYSMDDKEAAGSAANNLGYLYKNNLNDYKKAEEWYKKGIDKDDTSAPLGLGLMYKKLHQYDNAIVYYKKAYEMGNFGGATSLGYLYDVILKNTEEGIKWYKKAAQGGDADAINNLGSVYYEQGDKIRGSAYIFAMVNYGYSKQEVYDFLKNDWKIDEATLKQAYQLQKTLDIPKHYYDAELEDNPTSKSKNPRGQR
ncbi:MAG: tetratricopeptide repeat protein [Desulfamplus sp.]|jgi:TPR repeat protein